MHTPETTLDYRPQDFRINQPVVEFVVPKQGVEENLCTNTNLVCNFESIDVVASPDTGFLTVTNSGSLDPEDFCYELAGFAQGGFFPTDECELVIQDTLTSDPFVPASAAFYAREALVEIGNGKVPLSSFVYALDKHVTERQQDIRPDGAPSPSRVETFGLGCFTVAVVGLLIVAAYASARDTLRKKRTGI
jgi:hypothetical protein